MRKYEMGRGVQDAQNMIILLIAKGEHGQMKWATAIYYAEEVILITYLFESISHPTSRYWIVKVLFDERY